MTEYTFSNSSTPHSLQGFDILLYGGEIPPSRELLNQNIISKELVMKKQLSSRRQYSI